MRLDRGRRKAGIYLWPLALTLLTPTWARADEAVDDLRAELEALRTEYEHRIETLERRLAALEGGTPESAPSPGDELAALRAAAAAAAGTEAGASPSAPSTGSDSTSGRGSSLAALNPEISATGIFVGAYSDATDDFEFEAEEFELDLQSALDPFSRVRLTLAVHEEEIEVEEGFIAYSALPGGLNLMAGRFRQRFGALNRQHAHALPQTDYPLPIQLYLGEEGLAQTGLSLSWLLPRPWAHANELTLELTDGDGEAFAGEDFEQLAGLVHLKNYWDLSDAAYFEVGLSGAIGEGAEGDRRSVSGLDWTFHWQPPARARYRELTWRSELLRSERESLTPGASDLEAWGGYSYLEGTLRENLSLGLRVDGAEYPDSPELRVWSLAPYLTWWQSEYVRLRAGLRWVDDDLAEDTETQLILQLTWAAGPHKHETY